MNCTALAAWLKKRHHRAFRISAATAGIYLLLGIGAVSALFLFGWVVCLYCFPGQPLMLALEAVVCTAITLILILDARSSRRDDLTNFLAWLCRETLGIGPRLLVEGWREYGRARRWRPMDYENTAQVLAWLAQRTWAVSSADMILAFPHLRWSVVDINLSAIPGVLFLGDDRSRVTLLPPLRLLIRQLAGLSHTPPFTRTRRAASPEPEPERRQQAQPERLQPHEILGVSPDATLAEIKAAYRTRVKECHPDRFAQMDKASQALAEEWTKSLNAAYAQMVNDKRAATR